jgi:hypothetical protein
VLTETHFSTLPPALQEQVKAELSDPRYLGRRHCDTNTYNKGCRGPLCSQAKSDRDADQHARRVGRPVAQRQRKARAATGPALQAIGAAIREMESTARSA